MWNYVCAGVKVSSKGLYKIGECTHAWRKVVAKSQRPRGTGVSTVVSKSALNRVWSFRRFEKIGCLGEEILVLCITFTRLVSTFLPYTRVVGKRHELETSDRSSNSSSILFTHTYICAYIWSYSNVIKLRKDTKWSILILKLQMN